MILTKIVMAKSRLPSHTPQRTLQLLLESFFVKLNGFQNIQVSLSFWYILYIYRKHYFNGHFHVNHKKLKSCTFACFHIYLTMRCNYTPHRKERCVPSTLVKCSPKKGQLITKRISGALGDVN